MTDEEVNMKFIQDLLNWVEEMQVSWMCGSFKLAICMKNILKCALSFYILKLQLDRSEWGNDLPSVETHIDNHSSVHRAVEEFQMSLKDAKLSEVSMSEHSLHLRQFY